MGSEANTLGFSRTGVEVGELDDDSASSLACIAIACS